MSTLAVIPARGGSKGLPGKHLLPLDGRPLIAWTLEAARMARCIDRVLVTSDDETILAVCAEYGAETLRRPASLAGDDIPSEPVLMHALAQAGANAEVLVLLQPTSPFRTAFDIQRAHALLETHDAVISVCKAPFSPWKCFYEEAGCLRGITGDDTPFMPRQRLPEAWMPNGAIYGIGADRFRRSGRLFAPRTAAYRMPLARSIDIDVAEDLEEARARLRSQTGRAA